MVRESEEEHRCCGLITCHSDLAGRCLQPSTQRRTVWSGGGTSAIRRSVMTMSNERTCVVSRFVIITCNFCCCSSLSFVTDWREFLTPIVMIFSLSTLLPRSSNIVIKESIVSSKALTSVKELNILFIFNRP